MPLMTFFLQNAKHLCLCTRLLANWKSGKSQSDFLGPRKAEKSREFWNFEEKSGKIESSQGKNALSILSILSTMKI